MNNHARRARLWPAPQSGADYVPEVVNGELRQQRRQGLCSLTLPTPKDASFRRAALLRPAYDFRLPAGDLLCVAYEALGRKPHVLRLARRHRHRGGLAFGDQWKCPPRPRGQSENRSEKEGPARCVHKSSMAQSRHGATYTRATMASTVTPSGLSALREAAGCTAGPGCDRQYSRAIDMCKNLAFFR